MYFEHELTDEVYMYEMRVKLDEDMYRLDRMRGWVLLAFIPILFLMMYMIPNEGAYRFGKGYRYGFFMIVIGDIIYEICKKQILRNKAKKITDAYITHQKLSPNFPKVGVQLSESSVSVFRNDEVKTYPFNAIEKVIFDEELVLFVVKEDQSLFSIEIEDTRELYRKLEKKLKVSVFAMKSLKSQC